MMMMMTTTMKMKAMMILMTKKSSEQQLCLGPVRLQYTHTLTNRLFLRMGYNITNFDFFLQSEIRDDEDAAEGKLEYSVVF